MTAWRHVGSPGLQKGSGNKYHSRKVTVGGETFDSNKEARRWQELLLLEKSGEISGLRRQVRYLLIPEHREPDETGPRGGVRRGKLIESAVFYVADFVYFEPGPSGGEWIVEDTKGFKTRDYVLKRKLMLDRHGIRIRET